MQEIESGGVGAMEMVSRDMKGKQVSAYSDEQPGQGCALQSLS